MKVLIIGAGITGLSAATRLLEHGLNTSDITIVDKSRGPGGRMASRRIETNEGTARFDHGAQFFTARTPAFKTMLQAAQQAGAIKIWSQVFNHAEDNNPRWCGSTAMTDLCKWMVSSAALNVKFSTTVVNLGEYLKQQPYDAVIHTAPVPQALATLNGSGLLPAPGLARQLANIQYRGTVTVMLATSEQPAGLDGYGAMQFAEHEQLAFIADNYSKGISTVPAITVHLSNKCSESVWSMSDSEIMSLTLNAAAKALGDAADPDKLLGSSVQRWRYAEPFEPSSEGCIKWGNKPAIILAGEAFDRPRVEGAFTSGCAAADALF